MFHNMPLQGMDDVYVISLTGIHSSGKSALIKKFMDNNPFDTVKFYAIPTPMRDIYEQYGFKIGDTIPYTKRLEIHDRILFAWRENIEHCKKNEYGGKTTKVILTSTSPLDFMAYLLPFYSYDMPTEYSDETRTLVRTAFKYADRNVINTLFVHNRVVDPQYNVSVTGTFDMQYIAMHKYFMSMLTNGNSGYAPGYVDYPDASFDASTVTLPDNQSQKAFRDYIDVKRHEDLTRAVRRAVFPEFIGAES